MAIAILKPFGEGWPPPHMRGIIGNAPAGSVSVFNLVWDGTDFLYRGADCDGKILYAFPFMRGSDLLARTIYRECGGIHLCCLPDESCVELTCADCIAAGGSCGPPVFGGQNCDNVGAVFCSDQQIPCCHPDGTCSLETRQDCAALGGSSVEGYSLCADVDCETVVQGCGGMVSPPVQRYMKITISGFQGVRKHCVAVSELGRCGQLSKVVPIQADYSRYSATYYGRVETNLFGQPGSCCCLIDGHIRVPEGTPGAVQFVTPDGQTVWYSMAPVQVPSDYDAVHFPEGCGHYYTPPFNRWEIGACCFSINDPLYAPYDQQCHGVVVLTPHMGQILENNGFEWHLDDPTQTCPTIGFPINLTDDSYNAFYPSRSDPAYPNIVDGHGCPLLLENAAFGTATIEFVETLPPDWATYQAAFDLYRYGF